MKPITTANDFLHEVINPVLQDMDMWSRSAARLLLMTACHESGGFITREQIGGPALSFYQIEPKTLTDLYANHLRFHEKKLQIIEKFEPEGIDDPVEALRCCDRYATAVARLQYSRFGEPLPDADDLQNLGRYCKTYWNTGLGAATAEKYVADYLYWTGESA